MYIRRKVFSLLQNGNGEERYFSTKEILMEDEEERLFSIVDNEDLEQREFGNKENKAKTRKWRMENALNQEIQDISRSPLDSETKKSMIERRIQASKDNRILPTEGPGRKILDSETKKLASAQEALLNRSRQFGANEQQVRGVKKIKGAKPTNQIVKSKQERIQNLSPEYKKRYINKVRNLNNNSSSTQINSNPSPKPKIEVNSNSLSSTKPMTQPKVNSSRFVSKTSTWIKRNPKLTTRGALGLATIGTAGILGYNHYRTKKRMNDNKA